MNDYINDPARLDKMHDLSGHKHDHLMGHEPEDLIATAGLETV